MTAIVDQAIEEAAAAVIQDDIPLAIVPELLAALQGPAMRAVMAERVALIVGNGHTSENDDLLPVGWLPMEARQRFERIKTAMLEEPRDLAAIHALLVEGTALGLAAIDRLDRAMKRGES